MRGLKDGSRGLVKPEGMRWPMDGSCERDERSGGGCSTTVLVCAEDGNNGRREYDMGETTGLLLSCLTSNILAI